MKQKTDNSRQAVQAYTYTEEAKKNPRRVRLPDGRWVGVGGPISMVPTPPRLPYVVPEATPQELSFLVDKMGLKHLVQTAPPVVEDVLDVQDPDT